MSVWIKGPVCVRGTCWAPAPTKKHSQDQTVPIQLLMAVIIFKELTPFLGWESHGLLCTGGCLPLPRWMDGHSTRTVSDAWHSQGPEDRGHPYEWQLEKPYS